MSYEKTQINRFGGYSSEAVSEIADKAYARDILNLRMDKVGKLVTREGCGLGLHLELQNEYGSSGYAPYHVSGIADATLFASGAELSDGYEPQKRLTAFVHGKGIVGMGEYIFAEKWNAIDTDRVMVYYVRYDTDEAVGEHKNKGIYLFSPITGVYKDQLLIAPGFGYGTSGYNYNNINRDEYPCISISDKYDSNVQGTDFSGSQQLYAPNRQVNDSVYTGEAKEAPWQEHYIQMNQYDYKLVISDRVNGDLVIEDEFNRLQQDNTKNEYHELRLRPNCLSLFDVNVVDLQPRFNEENSGVKTGMCLLEYEFKKKITETHVDGTENKALKEDYTMLKFISNFSESSNDHNQCGVWGMEVRDNVSYRFTNADSITEYIDIESLPEIAGKASGHYINPFIWEDYKINYYPTVGESYNGMTLNELYSLNGKFLNQINRHFEQIYQTPPKITILTEHSGKEKEAILGVWQYRFVWDYGDGEYSAPSTTLSCPDIMWSATKDEWLNRSYSYSGDINQSGYYRPLIEGADTHSGRTYYNEWIPNSPMREHISSIFPKSNTSAYLDTDSIYATKYPLYSGSPADTVPKDTYLTDYGKSYYRLRAQLYSGVDYRFCPGVVDLDVCDINQWSYQNKGDLATDLFLDNQKMIKFNGIVASASCKTKWQQGDKGIELDYPEDNIEITLYDYLAVGSYKSKGYNSAMPPEISYCNLYMPTFPFGENDTPYNICKEQIEGKEYYVNTFCDNYGNLRLPLIGKIANGSKYFSQNIENRFTVPQDNNGVYLYTLETSPFFAYSEQAAPSYAVVVYDRSNRVVFLEQPSENNVNQIMSGYECLFPTVGKTASLYVGLSSPAGIGQDDLGLNGTDVLKAPYYRPFTRTKMIRNDRESYLNYGQSLDNEVANKLFKQGTVAYTLLENNNSWHLDSEYSISVKGINTEDFDDASLKGVVEYKKIYTEWWVADMSIYNDTQYSLVNMQRCLPGAYPAITSLGSVPPSQKWETATEPTFQDYPTLTIKAYLNGTRYLGHEQLTQVVPSSVLFDAPRIGLKIEQANVPTRAKKLLVFRTLSTHNNLWQPYTYGLVEKVEIKRDDDGNVVTKTDDWGIIEGLYYFDEIKDKELDFSVDINTYDGIAQIEGTYDSPIASRFNISLNDRMYYANYKEAYQPRKLDNSLYFTAVLDEGTGGFDSGTVLTYQFVYEDVTGVFSQAITTDPHICTFDNTNILFNRVPANYDGSIKQVNIYRDIDNAGYFYIGKLEPEDEGIFLDDNITDGAKMPEFDADITTNESYIRWSETFYPSKMKLENFIAAQYGDGDQITGLQSLYGNLIVFKENSCHRFQVQGGAMPITRGDELSPNIGCIAPNTLINVNNTLYFLSWQGIVRYDNNQFNNIDGAFAEELKHRIKETKDFIRDASMFYNPKTNEIILNLPMNNNNFSGNVYSYNTITEYFDRNRDILGHMYVISLNGYATKYSYPNSTPFQAKVFQGAYPATYMQHIYDGRQCIRMYYLNSMGEVRSSEIIPIQSNTLDGSKSIVTNNYYNETVDEKATDSIRGAYGDYGDDEVVNTDSILFDKGFTETIEQPIKVIFKSNYFTGNEENIIKRVRMNNFNVMSDGFIEVTFRTIADKADYNIINHKENNISETEPYIQKEYFNPTRSYTGTGTGRYYPDLDDEAQYSISGLGTNFLQIVNVVDDDDLFKPDDNQAKPISYSIEIESEKYININEMNFYWRPMRSYYR